MPAFGAGPVTTQSDRSGERRERCDRSGCGILRISLSRLKRVSVHCSTHAAASRATTVAAWGSTSDSFVRRVAHVEDGAFDPLIGHGGPIARQHSVAELGVGCGLPTGDPPQANSFTSTKRDDAARDVADREHSPRRHRQSSQAAQPAGRSRPPQHPSRRSRRQVRMEGARRRRSWSSWAKRSATRSV